MSRRKDHADRVEVRRDPDGTVDEVLLYVGGRVVAHLERMSDRAVWLGLYPGKPPSGDTVHVDFWAEAGDLQVRADQR